MTRQLERLERHVTISNEALAVFVRFWLPVTPPLPDTRSPPPRPRAASAMRASSRRSGGGWRAAQSLRAGNIAKT